MNAYEELAAAITKIIHGCSDQELSTEEGVTDILSLVRRTIETVTPEMVKAWYDADNVSPFPTSREHAEVTWLAMLRAFPAGAAEMNGLAAIITEYAQTCKDHPDALGEILRAWAFVGDGYGCYSNFDIRPEFEKVEATAREFSFLWGRSFDKDDAESNDYDYCDVEALKEISWHKHPCGIEMGWHWDGDGTLAFFVPELVGENHNGVIRNGDCKKDDEWEFAAAV